MDLKQQENLKQRENLKRAINVLHKRYNLLQSDDSQFYKLNNEAEKKQYMFKKNRFSEQFSRVLGAKIKAQNYNLKSTFCLDTCLVVDLISLIENLKNDDVRNIKESVKLLSITNMKFVKKILSDLAPELKDLNIEIDFNKPFNELKVLKEIDDNMVDNIEKSLSALIQVSFYKYMYNLALKNFKDVKNKNIYMYVNNLDRNFNLKFYHLSNTNVLKNSKGNKGNFRKAFDGINKEIKVFSTSVIENTSKYKDIDKINKIDKNFYGALEKNIDFDKIVENITNECIKECGKNVDFEKIFKEKCYNLNEKIKEEFFDKVDFNKNIYYMRELKKMFSNKYQTSITFLRKKLGEAFPDDVEKICEDLENDNFDFPLTFFAQKIEDLKIVKNQVDMITEYNKEKMKLMLLNYIYQGEINTCITPTVLDELSCLTDMSKVNANSELKNKPINLELLMEFIRDNLIVINFNNEEDLTKMLKIQETLKRGKCVDVSLNSNGEYGDVFVMSEALAANSTLITKNEKDFIGGGKREKINKLKLSNNNYSVIGISEFKSHMEEINELYNHDRQM